ncbi:hypothetical protein LINPERPRIM_LOCUS25367, partial [Linum perenne]
HELPATLLFFLCNFATLLFSSSSVTLQLFSLFKISTFRLPNRSGCTCRASLVPLAVSLLLGILCFSFHLHSQEMNDSDR